MMSIIAESRKAASKSIPKKTPSKPVKKVGRKPLKPMKKRGLMKKKPIVKKGEPSKLKAGIKPKRTKKFPAPK